MPLPDHQQTPRPRSSILARRKQPPSLRIDTPTQKPEVQLVFSDHTSASSLSSANSSANSEYDSTSPFSAKPQQPRKGMRNAKKLSLTLPSVHSNRSSNSLTLSDGESTHTNTTDGALEAASASVMGPKRQLSIASMGNSSLASRIHRKDEDDAASSPYADGPVQILPGIWLGNEDNALDWKGLNKRGIRAILNVAREVTSPFDSVLGRASEYVSDDKASAVGTFYPAQGSRPAMHYLKLPWSHGQPELVKDGFVKAMSFVDDARSRGDGVLVHCQCGVSRSATVVIALVMRSAASPSVPPELESISEKGFSGAYDFVKSKSGCIGPNMLLIYQLQDYQQVLSGTRKSPAGSESSSIVDEEEAEWSRRRQMLDEEAPEPENDRESVEAKEAYALDRAMEERRVARRASGSSLGSSGLGMGAAWKAKYASRKRTGSLQSNLTTGSAISEDLIEEDEKEELLGEGGGFDAPSLSSRSQSGETTEEEPNPSPDAKRGQEQVIAVPAATPSTAKPSFAMRQRLLHGMEAALQRPPPSAPPTKSSFDVPHSALPTKTSFGGPVPPSVPPTRTSFAFNARPSAKGKGKARPPPLSLPPVPSSPNFVVEAEVSASPPKEPEVPRRRVPPPLKLKTEPANRAPTQQQQQAPPPPQAQAKPRRPFLPSLRSSNLSDRSRSSSRSSALSQRSQASSSSLSTPSQTLFVFPPSPTLRAKTPHIVAVTSSLNSPLPFAGSVAPTPRVSTFQREGKRRSFINLAVPPTPTTACSRVDARGWVGLGRSTSSSSLSLS